MIAVRQGPRSRGICPAASLGVSVEVIVGEVSVGSFRAGRRWGGGLLGSIWGNLPLLIPREGLTQRRWALTGQMGS